MAKPKRVKVEEAIPEVVPTTAPEPFDIDDDAAWQAWLHSPFSPFAPTPKQLALDGVEQPSDRAANPSGYL